jgi:putative intracellular protease/amidase/YHS domain-containing protein
MRKALLPLALLLLIGQACSAQTQGKAIALDGLDPIEIIAGNRVKGNDQISATQGRFTYLFSKADNKATFLKDPSRFSIQLDGKCVMSDSMDGSMKLFQVKNGRIYLAGSEMCFTSFRDQPAAFVNLETGTRVAQAAPQHPPADTRPVAGILIFPGVQIIDYTGPYEVFGQSGFRVVLIAETLDPITTAMGMKVTPHHTFADAPHLEVLLTPGGNVNPDSNPNTVDWIKKASADAKYTMSVCNGAFWLAKAGLLDGKTATTYYGMIDSLKEAAPKATIVSNQRYTDNGTVLTTAGLSSGIDGSLYLVSKIRGHGAAQAVALNMEYDWNPKSTYARGSFADKPLRFAIGSGFQFPDGKVRNIKIENQAGDDKKWQKSWVFDSDIPAADLHKVVVDKLVQTWKRGSEKAASNGIVTDWTFSAEGVEWIASSTTEKVGDSQYRLVIELHRK